MVPAGCHAISDHGRGDAERTVTPAAGDVPQPHRPVTTGAGEQGAVGGERAPVHAGGVAGQHCMCSTLGKLPESNRPVVAGGGE